MILFCWLLASNALANETEDNNDGEGDAPFIDADAVLHVVVMRNGGNNTADAPVLRVELPRKTPFDVPLLTRWARGLGLLRTADSDELRSGGDVRDLVVCNRFGRPIRSAASIRRNGDAIFVVSLKERWFWPGFYVGTTFD